MLDTIRHRADQRSLRRFAIACCDAVRGLLDRTGLAAIEVGSRLADGRATEAERTAVEAALFDADEYVRDLEVAYGDVPPDDGPGPEWYAAEAAGGIIAADAWHGARVSARAVLDSSPAAEREALHRALCHDLRSLLKA